MITPRIIPALLLSDSALVKTIGFKERTYLGDPLNVVSIYNDLEVDELIFLDIDASREGQEPNFELIGQLSRQCFMPFSYGGGIRTVAHAKKIFDLGVEKIILNSILSENPELVTQIAKMYGSQAVVTSIDVKKSWLGKYEVVLPNKLKPKKSDPVEYAFYLQNLGAGEVFLNSVDFDGIMTGYDLKLIKLVTSALSIPVIACGGAGSLSDMVGAISAGASASAAGSIFVYQNKNRNVLVNYPTRKEIKGAFGLNG